MKKEFKYIIVLALTLSACTKNNFRENERMAQGPNSFSNAMAAQATGLKVGIYSGTGAESATTLALYRAVASMGHFPMAVTKADIVGNRLTTANFNVFIIPPGEDGKKCCAGKYADIDALDQIATKDAIRAYLSSGGGLVAEEAGAFFAAQNGGTLDIYSGNYTNITNQIGKKSITISDPDFGSGTQEAWHSYGGGYFPTPPASVSVVAKNSSNQAVIVKQSFGAGRMVLSSFVLELRGDTDLDWTIWDNWEMANNHSNSEGTWVLLSRMIGWAYNQNPAPSVINVSPNPPGSKVAIVSQHTSDGGAWPGLLPAVGRAIEYSGNIPLSIRFKDIIAGKLTLNNFKVVTFPGGYAFGYKTGLAGYESSIRNFVSAGGSYYGICAGSFYTPSTIIWANKKYSYPLGLYAGQDIGPINDIIAWPGYKAALINYSGDNLIGNFGNVPVMYYGGGYHTIPTDAQQGSHVYTAGVFANSSAAGKANLVRYTYGSGKVALSTSHLEALMGSNEDWMYWDNYDYTTGAALTGSGKQSWDVMKAVFNNWLTVQ